MIQSFDDLYTLIREAYVLEFKYFLPVLIILLVIFVYYRRLMRKWYVIARVVYLEKKVELLFKRTTFFIAGFSVFIGLIFVPATDELIVNVTAVYATILFLNESLRKRVPLISAESIQTTRDTGGEDTVIIRQRLEIQNEGDASIENLQCKYRVFDEGFSVKNDWQEKDFEGDAVQIDPQAKEKIEIDIAEADVNSEETYYIDIIVEPSPRDSNLSVRKLYTTD